MKAAMILSGCGCFDGSEIHEATILLLVLKQKGYEVDFFSIDDPIEESIDHHWKKPLAEKRNMMEMAARIARGHIQEMDKLHAKEYTLLAMPGGFGAAKNFSNYATKGTECEIHPQVSRVIKEFYDVKKPIITMCISPMIVAKVLEGKGIKLTAGNRHEDLEALKKMKACAMSCEADEACIDHDHRIYSVPAYMTDADPAKIYTSLLKIFEAL